MKKNDKGYEESIKTLDKMDKMTKDEIITVARELFRNISLDRKQIEDRYIATRKEFAEAVKQTIINSDYNPNKKQKEEDRANVINKYIAYVKQEAMLDYNRRLLQMINK